jgi:hypothetical protein
MNHLDCKTWCHSEFNKQVSDKNVLEILIENHINEQSIAPFSIGYVVIIELIVVMFFS